MATNPALHQKRQLHQSTAGRWFNEDDPNWDLAKGKTVNVDKIRVLLDQSLVQGFTSTLVYYACSLSADHTINIAMRMLGMLRNNNSGAIDAASLIRYRNVLTRDTEWYLGVISGFLSKWHDLGYEGISDGVVDLLENWVIKGNLKGDRIKRLDPTQGPLTDNELLAFNEGAVRVFEKGLIPISNLAVALLESNSGRRPIQLAHVKLCDLEPYGKNNKGESVRLIRIPRAKQQGAGFRQSFKAFAITEELWIILYAQRMHCINSVEQCLGRTLDDKFRMALPLFPDLSAFANAPSSNPAIWALLQTDHFHLTTKDISGIIDNVTGLANIHSERTGHALNIFATRFRYTIGTRAAREGLGPMIIAELLDHTDTQQVGIYCQNVPEHAAILDKKLSALLAPYAAAFQGTVLQTVKHVEPGENLCNHIRHRGEGAGVCGGDGSCGANVPIPCYTCFHFQALLDGPHERVLSELLAERQRVLDLTGDEQVAAANDRTILAVEQVKGIGNQHFKWTKTMTGRPMLTLG